MPSAPHILIVDDHREIRELVSRALTKDGFRVSTAADGRTMRQALADSRVDLILLDLMLPGEDGLSLCRNLRTQSNIPIIMLTAKGDEVDRVIGLEMGADDYLPKPFGSRELVARIKAVLRRSRETAPAPPIRPAGRDSIVSTAGAWIRAGVSLSAMKAPSCRSARASTTS
jgi:two-component system OmpR family response regulator